MSNSKEDFEQAPSQNLVATTNRDFVAAALRQIASSPPLGTLKSLHSIYAKQMAIEANSRRDGHETRIVAP